VCEEFSSVTKKMRKNMWNKLKTDTHEHHWNVILCFLQGITGVFVASGFFFYFFGISS
jgi:hypothetical protein